MSVDASRDERRSGRPGPAAAVLNPEQPERLLQFEYDRGSNYEADTRLSQALGALVCGEDMHHPDQRFFQVLHLCTEYAWASMHHDVVIAADALTDGDVGAACRALRRAEATGALPLTSVRLLASQLTQASLLAMRAQFPANTTGLDSPGARNLRRAAGVLWKRFEAQLCAAEVGLEDLTHVMPGASSAEERVGRHQVSELGELMIGLQQLDRVVLEWRRAHLQMVWLLIGGLDPDDDVSKPTSLRGTSTEDVERIANQALFPVLWQHSTRMFHRSTGGPA